MYQYTSRRSSLLKHLFRPLLLKNREHKTFLIYSIRLVDILFTSTSYSYSFRLNQGIILISKRPVRNTTRQSEHEERIGTGAIVRYLVYPNGKVMVFVACSNNPFKLEDEADESSLYSFLGQVRDRLLYLMTDLHERIVPPIMKWILTGCDINKDVTVSDKLQLTAINIQLKDADRVFRLYIKSLGDKAVYRVEESLKMRCSLVDLLHKIRSPSEPQNKEK